MIVHSCNPRIPSEKEKRQHSSAAQPLSPIITVAYDRCEVLFFVVLYPVISISCGHLGKETCSLEIKPGLLIRTEINVDFNVTDWVDVCLTRKVQEV
ncbi:hypothetical protein L1987_23987 [Smallanthus sonchifolius]|uniref:Uncharacterized protein n=1 Tax=Smallanthus sonchifolius TaxID=185202 RepID=A0ACB9IKM7_9ASTR|nr:hypothetical protein L1987_23987 [Smallanthus sonchifolius]